MNQKIQNKLTIGFEIEGAFRKELGGKLKPGGRFVHDGSVRITDSMLAEMGVTPSGLMKIPPVVECDGCIIGENGRPVDYCDEHRSNYHAEGDISQEYASPIFQSFDEALIELGKFTLPDYSWDYSSGLHTHIGMKNGNVKQLWSAASNLQFMKKLKKKAERWCPHQRERLNNRERENRYYHFWEHPEELIDNTIQGTKYRFARFHKTWNTVEFRFLVPCEHKVDNLVNLMDCLTEYLGNSFENVITKEIETDTPKTPELKIEINFEPQNSKLDIVKKLFKPDPIYEEGIESRWWSAMPRRFKSKLNRRSRHEGVEMDFPVPPPRRNHNRHTGTTFQVDTRGLMPMTDDLDAPVHYSHLQDIYFDEQMQRFFGYISHVEGDRQRVRIPRVQSIRMFYEIRSNEVEVSTGMVFQFEGSLCTLESLEGHTWNFRLYDVPVPVRNGDRASRNSRVNRLGHLVVDEAVASVLDDNTLRSAMAAMSVQDRVAQEMLSRTWTPPSAWRPMIVDPVSVRGTMGSAGDGIALGSNSTSAGENTDDDSEDEINF